MRSERPVSAKRVQDATVSEGKQCVQRDVTEADVSRRGAGRTCLMFVVFLRRMMSTLQWSRPETNVSSQPTCCCSVCVLLRSVARKCCSSLVSFLSLARGMQSGARNERTTEPDIAQTERVLTRLVDTASLDSRLHQVEQRVFPQHPCIESVPSCVVLARVARTTLRGSRIHTSRIFSSSSFSSSSLLFALVRSFSFFLIFFFALFRFFCSCSLFSLFSLLLALVRSCSPLFALARPVSRLFNFFFRYVSLLFTFFRSFSLCFRFFSLLFALVHSCSLFSLFFGVFTQVAEGATAPTPTRQHVHGS